jgi:hypothetical protein
VGGFWFPQAICPVQTVLSKERQTCLKDSYKALEDPYKVAPSFARIARPCIRRHLRWFPRAKTMQQHAPPAINMRLIALSVCR